MSKTAKEAIATWYRILSYRVGIEPVQVISFTDKTVTFFNGQREERNNRISDFYQYYPTWEEARQTLLRRWEQKAKSAESGMLDARYKVSQIQAMTPPEAA